MKIKQLVEAKTYGAPPWPAEQLLRTYFDEDERLKREIGLLSDGRKVLKAYFPKDGIVVDWLAWKASYEMIEYILEVEEKTFKSGTTDKYHINFGDDTTMTNDLSKMRVMQPIYDGSKQR